MGLTARPRGHRAPGHTVTSSVGEEEGGGEGGRIGKCGARAKLTDFFAEPVHSGEKKKNRHSRECSGAVSAEEAGEEASGRLAQLSKSMQSDKSQFSDTVYRPI